MKQEKEYLLKLMIEQIDIHLDELDNTIILSSDCSEIFGVNNMQFNFFTLSHLRVVCVQRGVPGSVGSVRGVPGPGPRHAAHQVPVHGVQVPQQPPRHTGLLLVTHTT